MRENEFTGILEKPEGVKTHHIGLLKQLAGRTDFDFVYQTLKNGGVRQRSALSLEKPPHEDNVRVIERSFRNMSEHNAVVALVADSIADLIGLPDSERKLLVTGAFVHDATKPLEVVMLGYLVLQREEDPNADHRRVLETTLNASGILSDEIPLEEVVNLMKDSNQDEFLNDFDRKINSPFIRRELEHSSFSPSDQEAVFSIATSDTAHSQLKMIARVHYFSRDIEYDEGVERFEELVQHLKEQGSLPELERPTRTDFLAMLLWYSDTIVAHTRVSYVDDRLDDVVKRGAWEEFDLNAKSIYGMTYFEASRINIHMIERILEKLAVEYGTIDPDIHPEELPRIIFENLQEKDTGIKQRAKENETRNHVDSQN